MEFADLNDEIIADDWLIPRREITRRRLVRQTRQYKIYKADWFGDVLVYEPIKAGKCDNEHEEQQTPRQSARFSHQPQQDFNSRLSELCLKLNSSRVSPRMYDDDDDDDLDSAYSSISTTPTQTRNSTTKQHEFQFPSASSSSGSLSSKQLQQQRQEDIVISGCSLLPAAEQQQDDESNDRKSRSSSGPSSRPPVILNKSWFFHNDDDDDDDDDEQQVDAMDNATHQRAKATSSSWFELNELRLVAHENFLLFMGASLHEHEMNESSASSSERSLVMQMSHPKSMSLFNLLHANKCDPTTQTSTCCSPIVDRFFAFGRQQQAASQKLSIAAKLNICQQVTNAMTYLHDKNIIHGRLTSVNIYLELNQRVKISLLDNDELPIGADVDNNSNNNSVSLNLPTLTYLSPELVQTISIVGKSDKKASSQARLQMDTRRLTKESDIYSFGTLLYELFHEKFPYAQDEQIQTTTTTTTTPSLNGAQLFEQLCLAASPSRRLSPSPRRQMQQQQQQHAAVLSPFTTNIRKRWNGNIKYSASELIYNIGSGQTKARNLHKDNQNNSNSTSALVDQIISTCWSSKPHERPTFKQLRFE